MISGVCSHLIHLIVLLAFSQLWYLGKADYFYIGPNLTIGQFGIRVYTEYYSIVPLYLDLALNSSQSFLSQSCSEWNTYDCDLDPDCTIDESSDETAVYPFYNITGNPGYIDLE